MKADGKVTVVNKEGRRVRGFTALLTSINRKQLPLCPQHHSDFEKGVYSAIDVEFLRTIFYNTWIPDSETLKRIFETGEAEISKHK